MNGTPPSRDEPDDVGEEYRRASAFDPSRPSEKVRRAVLDHAAKLAAERAPKRGGIGAKPRRPAANYTGWRAAIFGSLAAAGFAGILIAPHFLGRQAPPVAVLTAAQKARPSDGAAPPAQAPRAEYAPAARQDSIARQASGAARAPAADSTPAAKPAPGILADQPRVAEADSALKSSASAARNASVPMPPESRPVDPVAALRRAAEMGDTRELTALLDAPHDIDARDGGGRTPLLLAVLHGHARAVDVLLAHGADANAADARGTTPLQAAVAGDQQAIIRSLQRAGAR
jgi:hypothetical protein